MTFILFQEPHAYSKKSSHGLISCLIPRSRRAAGRFDFEKDSYSFLLKHYFYGWRRRHSRLNDLHNTHGGLLWNIDICKCVFVCFYEPLKKQKRLFFYELFKVSRGHIFDVTIITMRPDGLIVALL